MTEVAPASTTALAPPPTTREPYQEGPSVEALRSGATLRRGHSGESVAELQRMLNASGAEPPLVVDGLFGPKTEAATRTISAKVGPASSEVSSSLWSSLTAEAARSTPRPAPEPRAPKYGEPAPEGTVTAGSLRRDAEARTTRKSASGAPPGYHTMTGRIPSGVVAQAKSLLHHDYGTEIPFDLDGKRYLARLERHYHPPGYVGGPNGWHKGVTVYEAND